MSLVKVALLKLGVSALCADDENSFTHLFDFCRSSFKT